jgi:hypothetical protein
MTNNVQTAAEWNQVIDNLELAKKSTLTQVNGLREQSATLQSQRAELSAQLTRAQQGEDQEYIAVIRSEISKVDNRIAGNKVVTSNVLKEVAQYDQDLNNAFLQQAKAKSGPPNDISTTPPANATFGSNTSVPAPELDPPVTSQSRINAPNTPTSSITPSSPNNVRTAAEWNQVIDNIEVAKKSTLTQANGLREQSATLQAQRAELSAQLTRAQQGDDQEYIAAIRSEISKVDNRIAGNKVVTSNVMKEVAQYDQDLNNAFLQQTTAKSGPPNSNSTTQPANATFGPNTSVAAPALDPPITSQVQINTPNIPISPVAQSSSNNVQTAEEWKKVAAEQQSIAKEAGDKERLIGSQLADVFSEKEKLDKQIRNDANAVRVLGAAVARGEKLEPEAQKRYDTALARSESDKARAAELDAQRVSLQSQAAPYTEQRTNAENAAQAALNKSKEALEANPNANSVPAPVGDSINANSTGSSTDAQPDPSTVESANAQQTVSDTVGATQAEADFINAEAQKQVEAELGATQAEADFIKAEEQKQIETELGATQAEADIINAEAQKQVSDEEISGLTTEAAAIQTALDEQVAAEANSERTREGRRGLLGELQNTREQAITQDTLNYNQLPDWRVRISLAQGASYLYKVQNPGILKPLQATNGVVFPYTPSIQMGYVSNYDAFELVHSNYKIFQYKNSAVEQLSITADFTAQDATEAAYVLAVIHFFRTVTKMFYGKDQNPKPGTPPPLCYINGMGDFQFNQHPLVISNFSYTLPNDVDYIRAGAPTLPAGQSSSGYSTPNNSTNTSTSRMQSNNVPAGGQNAAPNWTTQTNIEPTYIPTKIQVSITALPIVTRKDISDNFSVRDYATGALMRGRQNSRGGIW